MTIEKFMTILQGILVLTGVIVVFSFLFFKRRTLQIKLLGAHFLAPILVYYSLGVFDLRGMQVNVPHNVELLFSFLTITAIYYIQFQKRYSRLFLTLGVFFIIFWFTNILFIQKMFFNSFTASFLNFIIMAYCVTYFYRLLIDLPAQHLQQVPMFWISTGFLVQGAGAFFLYLFTDYLTKFFFNDVLIYWTIHNLMGIFQLILVIIGVSIDLRNTIQASRKDKPIGSSRESLLH
ncbi:hypothetical protein [Chryseolinea soli]|uniref:Uncharacterized protein n=1 Tax=Chryseolinea soli TaxID=2321403 RepID=A0A385SJ55_9BACT|nr:hypothetical protein [Chryseolinea soli]AYB30506.1 hypothetical protein D4L85_07890 [Chryseolinea soli]